MKSPVYWNASIYHFVIRKLYGKDFKIRYSTLVDLIPEHSSVVELCMGDGFLYEKYMKQKKVKYLGLDINKTFVRFAEKRNISAKLHNLLSDEIPPADIVLMQGSLYQFIPEEKNIIRRMLDASRKMVLLAEPVHNRAHSKNWMIRYVSQYAVNPGTGHKTERFNEQSLLECFRSFSELKKTIKVGKEIIGIFEK